MEYSWLRASLMTQTVKNPPAMQETWVQSLCQEDPLEEEMPTLSSILSCLENPMKRGACPWGHKESDTTEQLTHTHTHQSSGKNSMKIRSFIFIFCLRRLLCLKAMRGIRFTTNFSSETMETKGARMTYSKCWNKTHHQTRILYLANIKHGGEMNTFSDKQRLREFVAIWPVLWEIT